MTTPAYRVDNVKVTGKEVDPFGNLQISSTMITAKSRTPKAKWTVEHTDDLKAFYGV